jgi:hypothetical protein
MHQKQPPAKVAFSNLSSETFPFVESPEAVVVIISIIPKVKAISLAMTITSFCLSSAWGRKSCLNSKHGFWEISRTLVPLHPACGGTKEQNSFDELHGSQVYENSTRGKGEEGLFWKPY